MIRGVFVLVLVLLILGYFLGRRLRRLPAPQARRLVRRWLWLAGGALLVGLAVTGRLHWLFGVLGGVIPVLQRLADLRRRVKRAAARNHSAGRTSSVETRCLRMTLDHGSGRLDGVVLEGAHQGRRLGEMGQEELVSLLRHCRVHDPDGARLLETYLDRRFGPRWRQAGGDSGGEGGAGRGHGRPRGVDMSEAEAREILGVGPEATPAEIRRAHRRLMQKYHPDRGGSTEMAARLNRAKEVLLGRRR